MRNKLLYWIILFTSFITGAKELLTVMYGLYCIVACVLLQCAVSKQYILFWADGLPCIRAN